MCERCSGTVNYSERLHKIIPSGCHTYSRGDKQFPINAPMILKGGRDAYVFDNYGRQYLDYGMGLRSIAIGYAETEIVEAALDGMLMGNCLTRPSMIELEAAEIACSLLQMDMVKFTKNGSTATTAAVKLARAATGRSIIACARQPFFSYDDWFIGTTKRNGGIPECSTVVFDNLDEIPHNAACVILEPKDHDLLAIRKLCDANGIILIFDEMITGFRYDWPSVGKGLADLSCFGKAMANGFSVACVGGKREIMEIGSRDDFFFASTTHGAEMSGLAAFIATERFMRVSNVSAHLIQYRDELLPIIPACLGGTGNALVEKTLFMQEMCKRGILMPYVSPCYRHGEKEMAATKLAAEQSLDAIGRGATLEGDKICPVF